MISHGHHLRPFTWEVLLTGHISDTSRHADVAIICNCSVFVTDCHTHTPRNTDLHETLTPLLTWTDIGNKHIASFCLSHTFFPLHFMLVVLEACSVLFLSASPHTRRNASRISAASNENRTDRLDETKHLCNLFYYNKTSNIHKKWCSFTKTTENFNLALWYSHRLEARRISELLKCGILGLKFHTLRYFPVFPTYRSNQDVTEKF